MRTTKPITIFLPTNILYVTSRRWRCLRQWGAQTAERLELKMEKDLLRLVDRVRAQGGKNRR